MGSSVVKTAVWRCDQCGKEVTRPVTDYPVTWGGPTDGFPPGWARLRVADTDGQWPSEREVCSRACLMRVATTLMGKGR